MIPDLLAHAGHWFTALAFFGPVLVLPLALLLFARRTREDDGGDRGDDDTEAGGRATQQTPPDAVSARRTVGAREW